MKNNVKKEQHVNEEKRESVREIDEATLAEALKETSLGTAGACQTEYDSPV